MQALLEEALKKFVARDRVLSLVAPTSLIIFRSPRNLMLSARVRELESSKRSSASSSATQAADLSSSSSVSIAANAVSRSLRLLHPSSLKSHCAEDRLRSFASPPRPGWRRWSPRRCFPSSTLRAPLLCLRVTSGRRSSLPGFPASGSSSSFSSLHALASLSRALPRLPSP